MSKVAILGCGPAGLLAAHACAIKGRSFNIFSKHVKSVLNGAQYLHDPIPDISLEEPDGMLSYMKLGAAEGYARKVYGDPRYPTSWEKFPEGELPAWSLVKLYDELWDRYGSEVHNVEVDAKWMVDLHADYQTIISAIPAKAVCHRPHHQFKGREVIFSDVCEPSIRSNTIVYSGDPAHWWYRSSLIFGYASTESTELGSGRVGIKPTSTNCTCWPDLVRVGRFGQWRRGVLVHHAFREACDAL